MVLPFTNHIKMLKTHLFTFCYNIQARQWINMWHARMGDGATPMAMIALLDSYGFAKDVADKIRREYSL